jgi:hypothetical protein
MKEADKTEPKLIANGPRKKPAKRAFKNFAEYWHFVKNLPDYQRKLLVNSMSSVEQKSLKASYDKGGWEDLFMRNACDETLDEIKQYTDIDLVQLRVKVLAGKPQLMNKTFWQYINNCFEKVPFEHISYIFEGITIEDFDADYVKLVKFVFED